MTPREGANSPHEREKKWAEKVESKEEQLLREVLITLFLSPSTDKVKFVTF